MKPERPDTNDDLNTDQMIEEQRLDVIQQTRKMIKNMSESEKLKKAKQHLQDALAYRTPRPDTHQTGLSKLYRRIYHIQTSKLWYLFLFILSYFFMYLVILDNAQHYVAKIILEWIILFIMWVDVAFQVYHKSFQTLKISSKFQTRFYVRVAILVLLVVDLMIFTIIGIAGRPIRPFRLLRGVLPVFYDSFVRKSFEALFAAYKDIIVYLFFYSLIIVGFALVANQIIQIPPGTQYDDYASNYVDLGKTIFVIYVMSTYDSYPDNQIVAIDTSIYQYAFFILFIFFNVFFFVVIPATLIFNSFRDTRSKILLIDEIKQQHSLILCFVSLGEENLNISLKKLVKFLLYVYKNKVRYVDCIAEVCLRLDQNNNGYIQISEFMQLCKVLQYNSSMMPPSFGDWNKWIKLKAWIDKHIGLRELVQSKKFKLFSSILIIYTFINSFLALFTPIDAFDVIDNVLMALYVLQVLLRLVGLGPEDYFDDKWNKLDFILVTVSLALELTPASVAPHNSDVLFKMTRIFRITILIKLMFGKTKNSLYRRTRQLLGQTAIIIPIVLKFFPMYMITYYVLGIIGMEIFYGDTAIAPSESKYSVYNKYSNFQYFMGTQFIMVQILVEAGWSMLAFDHSQRYGYYGLVMIYFVLCHAITVLILSSLLKGLVWEVYFTVHEQYEKRFEAEDAKQYREHVLQKKVQQIEEIKTIIEGQKEFINPNTLIKKELYQNKLDLEVLRKIKQHFQKKLSKRSSRSKIVSHFMEDRKILIQEINFEEGSEWSASSSSAINSLIKGNNDEEEVIQYPEDFQQEMEKVMSRLILSPKIKFSEAIVYPKQFVAFLEKKLKQPINSHVQRGFDVNSDPIFSKQSLTFLTYEMNVILGIQKSKREQKTLILKNMVHEGLLSEEDAARQAVRKSSTRQSIDVNWVIRNTFLGSTNEDLIKKFQIEYFSDIYGQSFRDINKVTIEPLLRYEATLTYCLRNLMRYPHINELQFFQILSHLQDTFSNKLLKKGSLFKFVFQIDCQFDSWFTIQLKQTKDIHIRFIKSGIWAYNRGMHSNQFYYGKDIFNWDVKDRQDRLFCQRYMKMFYQGFESLAFCLANQSYFFTSNPNINVYDLFCFHADTRDVPRGMLEPHSIKISKMMLVMLSKEQIRTKENKLQYTLTQFLHDDGTTKTRNLDSFKFDQSQNQTFAKLKRLAVMDQQRIVESEGIPFAFVVNLMSQVRDTLKLYPSSLVHHVQRVLNRQFDTLNLNDKQKVQNRHDVISLQDELSE